MPAKAAIIICTCNRAQSLALTLESMRGVDVPSDLAAELLIVDNGSTDGTAAVARAYQRPGMSVRHVVEPRRGQCFARNRGLSESMDADVILFTDDDVRPPRYWLRGMVSPILEKRSDAVAGGVSIAPHLLRAWMTPLHRSMLASSERLDPARPAEMVGANMAFGRRVLERVPAFDTELGPGALGFGDETLFSWQLRRAGFRIAAALDVAVEHHFDESRLTRASYLDAAKKHGRVQAYHAHHWHHSPVKKPELYFVKRNLRLMWWRTLRRRECTAAEGTPQWELNILMDIHFNRHYLTERRRPRNYEREGLVKLRHRAVEATPASRSLARDAGVTTTA